MFEIDYKPHVILHYIPYVLSVWFLFILIAGGSRYRPSSLILSSSWVLYSYIMFSDLMTSGISHIEQMGILISVDFATALALTLFMVFDKAAWKYALVLVFAILCHTVVSYILTSGNSQNLRFMYIWYSELIILTCILQMIISYDGAIRAFRNVQMVLLRSVGDNNNFVQDLFVHKKREKRS